MKYRIIEVRNGKECPTADTYDDKRKAERDLEIFREYHPHTRFFIREVKG